MRETFTAYAEVYDLVYADKDYAAETAFVERLLRRHCPRARRLLDVAAGTGGHALLLAEHGFEVHAQDLSKDMAARAERKARERSVRLAVRGGADMRALEAPAEPFDAVVCLFSSIDYLLTAADVSRFFAGVRRALAPGGVFVFDFWNGIATLRGHQPTRARVSRDGERRVVRISETRLLPLQSRAEVHFRFLVTGPGEPVREFEEIHHVRYFFPLELTELLEASGLRLVEAVPFLDETRAAEPDDANLTFVAVAS